MGLDSIYLVIVPLALIAFVAVLGIREIPLRSSQSAAVVESETEAIEAVGRAGV